MSGTCADTPKAAASAMARARLPAAISDFEGTQPVLRHSPPILPFSISTTGTPKAAAAAATTRPPEPAPMTQRSVLMRSAMIVLRPKGRSGISDLGLGARAAPPEAFDDDRQQREQSKPDQAG